MKKPHSTKCPSQATLARLLLAAGLLLVTVNATNLAYRASHDPTEFVPRRARLFRLGVTLRLPHKI